MTTDNSTSAQSAGPAAWVKLSDEDWVALHVPRFKQVRPYYAEYKLFLERILGQAAGKYAPLSIVGARPKAIPSFADKILRKRGLYTDPKDPLPPDPLVRMTDLCGARVITQTARQVERICAFIKEAFDVDWANSEDASSRLKPTEFGYRSVHYIVQVNPAKLRALGFPLPVPDVLLGPVCPEDHGFHGLKAEIQVRTLLEHASADIGHDTLYKTGMKVADPIRRQFAALAAVLEGADREFDRLLGSLNDLKSHSGAWHKPDEMRHEITRLRIILKCEPDSPELAVRVGQLALAIGEQREALEVLQPFAASRDQGVQRVRGLALTELYWDEPFGAEFEDGVKQLEAAAHHSQADAETLCALAECHAHRGKDGPAADLFHKALVLDPTEPLSLCRFLEFEVARQRNDAILRLAEPMIQRALDRCRREIEAGVNLPVAWSCLAVFQLLLKQPYPALHSLAQVLTLCGKPSGEAATGRPCATGRVLRRTRETVEHLEPIREKLEGFDCFERLLMLGLAVSVKDTKALAALQEHASWAKDESLMKPDDRVVIVSGACEKKLEPAVAHFRPEFRRALEGLSLNLVSGGTPAGVCGVAGETAAESNGKIRAFGYLPASAPADEQRYFHLGKSKTTDYTPLDALQGWTDIVAAGIDPHRVRHISFAGGAISQVEYAVALALGAWVGVIDSPVIPPDRRFENALWQEHPHLLRLPLDAMTLRTFLLAKVEEPGEADRRKYLAAARQAHEDYARSARPKDPSLQEWDKLPEALKLSNYHQVMFWEITLREYGLGVRPADATARERELLNMEQTVGAAAIQRLAELEHGRWNVERLARGWRYAEDKVVEEKKNPCLVPWPELTNIKGTNYQKYDIEAVENLPKKFLAAGLEIYRL